MTQSNVFFYLNLFFTKNPITVCFKIQDTSPIVSLLFWLNSDLLNLWEKSGLIVIAIILKEFQR